MQAMIPQHFINIWSKSSEQFC